MGVQRWIDVSALKLEEDLLPVVRVNSIKISRQEHKLIGTVQSSPCPQKNFSILFATFRKDVYRNKQEGPALAFGIHTPNCIGESAVPPIMS